MQQAESRADQNCGEPWTSLLPVQVGMDTQEQGHRGELPPLISLQQLLLLKLPRNPCITPKREQAQQSSQPTQYPKVTGPGAQTQRVPMETGSPSHTSRGLPAHLQHSSCVKNPSSQLPHHIVNSGSPQTSPYHLPQDSPKLTSHLKTPTRTISRIIFTFFQPAESNPQEVVAGSGISKSQTHVP